MLTAPKQEHGASATESSEPSGSGLEADDRLDDHALADVPCSGFELVEWIVADQAFDRQPTSAVELDELREVSPV
jgi:hypothetical protein